VRYGWPSDGSHYIWWTKGDMATLYWKDGANGGVETVLHADCKAQ
jgi:membrane-bound inhibitor of C-type lysozyme